MSDSNGTRVVCGNTFGFMRDGFVFTHYSSALAAAHAWADEHGVVGRKGGWLYKSNGKPLCQGWQSLVGQLARDGVLRDLDGERLSTRSDTPKDRNDKWAGLRRNVFDGGAVMLRSQHVERIVASERDEQDSCEAGTPSCCIDHTAETTNGSCETW